MRLQLIVLPLVAHGCILDWEDPPPPPPEATIEIVAPINQSTRQWGVEFDLMAEVTPESAKVSQEVVRWYRDGEHPIEPRGCVISYTQGEDDEVWHIYKVKLHDDASATNVVAEDSVEVRFINP